MPVRGLFSKMGHTVSVMLQMPVRAFPLWEIQHVRVLKVVVPDRFLRTERIVLDMHVQGPSLLTVATAMVLRVVHRLFIKTPDVVVFVPKDLAFLSVEKIILGMEKLIGNLGTVLLLCLNTTPRFLAGGVLMGKYFACLKPPRNCYNKSIFCVR